MACMDIIILMSYIYWFNSLLNYYKINWISIQLYFLISDVDFICKCISSHNSIVLNQVKSVETTKTNYIIDN